MNEISIREQELQSILKTLSHHVMDEDTYTAEQRLILLDTALQLLRISKGRA